MRRAFRLRPSRTSSTTRGCVSEGVRARVLDAVERCGYYPNAHARSLASGRSQTLGLVVSDISNPFFPELIKSIEAAAFERGYDLILSNTDYDPGRTSHYVRRFIERKVAGVVVMTSELDKKLLGELASRDVSVVFLDLGKPGIHMSNLSVNYEAGIEEAIGHLVALGHREIAFVSGPEKLRSAARGARSFPQLDAPTPAARARALLPRRLQARRWAPGRGRDAGGHRAADGRARGQRPDGVRRDGRAARRRLTDPARRVDHRLRRHRLRLLGRAAADDRLPAARRTRGDARSRP